VGNGEGPQTHVVFSPEFEDSTQHTNVSRNFAIFGGVAADCNKAAQLWQEVFTGYHHIVSVDFETAELVKYAENIWFAS
jgi:UDP-N-acetyl-D-mannosaminuronate dehydrogenase